MAERQDPLSAAGDRDAFVAHADRLAACVAAAAVETATGVAWPLPGRSRPSFHLYDGTLGVALFLAAHARLRGADAHRDLALRAAAPLRRTLVALVRDPAKAAETVLPLGGMIGLGGYVYGLVRIGEWLESPETVRDAGEAAALFTDARIDRDERLDVVGGCAGAVLALLA
ncbi:MAG TPA: lanthionine synthetase LanC family protein, partial [Longimicrobium sp.]|nr:lanthionine synthetase LanC family protein [Longimicrobium sp.]